MTSRGWFAQRGLGWLVALVLLFGGNAQAAGDLLVRIPEGGVEALALKPRTGVPVPATSFTATYRLLDPSETRNDFFNVARIGLQGDVGGECQLVVQGIHPGFFTIEVTGGTHLLQPAADASLVPQAEVVVYGILITSDPSNLSGAPLPLGTQVSLTAHLIPKPTTTSLKVTWEIRSPSGATQNAEGQSMKFPLSEEGTWKVKARAALAASEPVTVASREMEIPAAATGAYITLSRGGDSTRVVGQNPNDHTVLGAELFYSEAAFPVPEIQWHVTEPDATSREPTGRWVENIYAAGLWGWGRTFFADPSARRTAIYLRKKRDIGSGAQIGRYFIKATLRDRTMPGRQIEAVTVLTYLPTNQSGLAELKRSQIEDAFFDVIEEESGQRLEILPNQSYVVSTKKTYQVKVTYTLEVAASAKGSLAGPVGETTLQLTKKLVSAIETSRTTSVDKAYTFKNDKSDFEYYITPDKRNYGCFEDRVDWLNYVGVLKLRTRADMVLYERVKVEADGTITPSRTSERILVLVPPPLADLPRLDLYLFYEFRKIR